MSTKLIAGFYRFILLSVAIFIAQPPVKVQAQRPIEFQNMIQVSTVSPNSASLGKFGNIPVSYATGVPSITIPLYQISIGKINLPFSLDYHASGVRVDEVSSSVGTSWALSGIPEISRNMIGLPDEANGGYLSAVSLDSLYNYYQYANYTIAKKMSFAQFIYDVRNNIKDTEPDVFSYTLNGSSGKFIFRPNGTIMQIPVTNNRIERIYGGNYKITDENGQSYIFDQKEQTEIVSGSATGPGTYTSTWKLSKMISSNLADTVYFNYLTNSGCTERSWNFSYTLGNRPTTSEGSTNEDATGENASVSQIHHQTELLPKEILWRGGKITFKNVGDRTDRQEELRLDSVKIYSKLNGAYQLNKSVKLYQSYFYSNPVPGAVADYRNYRLRLDSVAYLPVNSTLKPQSYQMTYNNNPIAPNESFGQDIWGYNNGKFSNTSLMPIQTVLWQGTYRVIGEANMDPDSANNYVQSCMLQTMKYPTKGYSVFNFEPHKYPLSYQSTQQQSVGCDTYGSVQSSNTSSFTVQANQSNFSYRVRLSAYNYPGVTNRPQAKMVDQTTGQQVFFVSNVSNPSQAYDSGTIALTLVVGHTYLMSTDIYTNNANVTAQSLVSWSVPISGVSIKFGGGLRIGSVTNYDANNSFINKETYQYGNDGTGKLLTDATYLLVNYERVFYELGYCNFTSNQGNTLCPTIKTGDVDIVYHAKSIYPATQFSGSPVVYGGVTKFETNSTGQPKGKSEFVYYTYGDQAALPSTDYGLIGTWLISNPWKNGFLSKESIYKSVGSNFKPLKITNYNYKVYRPDTLLGLKIKPLYIQMSGGVEHIPDTVSTRSGPISVDNSAKTHYFIGRIPAYTGAMLLQTKSDTIFDDLDNKAVQLSKMYYDDPTHILLTRMITYNSKGDSLTSVTKYPHDFSSGSNVYQTMLNRNMVAPVVRAQQLKNNTQTALANINYFDWFGNGSLLAQQTVDGQILAKPIENRVKFNKYDAYGNILEQQKTDAPPQSYRWGYYNQYPVAVVSNAKWNDIFYESFEEGAGNSPINDSKTGHYSKLTSYSKTLTGLDAGAYILSYWAKSGGSWSLITIPVTVTGNSYPISITGQVDDVRFYPSDAQMNTYTYDPLIGMTSAADQKNQVTYYEYDGFLRLINIKDKDGNIVKHTDYHFQGQ